MTAVESVLNDFVEEKKTFTAFDVTKELRKTQKVYHSQVKKEVHEFMSDVEEYEKMIATISNNPAIVYYHEDTSFLEVEDYIDSVSNPQGTNSYSTNSGTLLSTVNTITQTNKPVQTNSTINSISVLQNYKLNVDNRDRVWIKTSTVAKLGLSFQDRIFLITIQGEKNKLYLSTAFAANSFKLNQINDVKDYGIDKSNNAAIPLSVIASVGIDTSAPLYVFSDSNGTFIGN